MEDKDKEKARPTDEEKTGLSRRKWLIDVGKAAALAGIAGKAGPLPANAFPLPTASESKPETLPPGLYRPSPGHLGSALEDYSRFHPVPAGCPVDFIRPRNRPFEPQFFSPDEYKAIHRLTALMLGETHRAGSEKSSDGNIVDEVAEWIDLHTYSFAEVRKAAEQLTPEHMALAKAYDDARLVHRVKTTDAQKTYRDGLAWIAERSKQKFQREFVELGEDQQMAILNIISDDRSNKDAEDDGTRFFRLLKGDIISGFYTSRTGLNELDYKGNRYYAVSPGCALPGHPHLKNE